MNKVSNLQAPRNCVSDSPIPPVAWSPVWGPAPTQEEAAALEAMESLRTACQKLHPVLIRIIKGKSTLAEVVEAVTDVEAAILAAGGTY